MRRAAKVDTTQEIIVDALRKAGYDVYITKIPTDLEVTRPEWANCFVRLECKSLTGKRNPKARIRRTEQKSQSDFCDRHQVPYIATPEAALKYMASVGL